MFLDKLIKYFIIENIFPICIFKICELFIKMNIQTTDYFSREMCYFGCLESKSYQWLREKSQVKVLYILSVMNHFGGGGGGGVVTGCPCSGGGGGGCCDQVPWQSMSFITSKNIIDNTTSYVPIVFCNYYINNNSYRQ